MSEDYTISSADEENNELLKQHTINFENLPSLEHNGGISAKYLRGYNNVLELLTAFAQYLEVSKRIGSANTKSAYLSNTKQFLIWCNKLQFPIKNITKTRMLRNLVICYEKALSATDLAQNSKALKHASIRKFFEWYSFMHEDYNISLPKCFSPDWCTTADSKAYKKQTRINTEVFDAIKEQANLGDINDRWIFYFLAFGCRRSEIAEVKVSDVDFLNKEINIYQGKTHEVKKLPLPAWLTSPDILDKKHNFLIHNHSKRSAKTKGSKKVSNQFIWLKVSRWISKTKFKDVDCSPHAFRRYFVNALLKQGASDSNIAKIGGWANLNMVQRYGYDISLTSNPIIQKGQIEY